MGKPLRIGKGKPGPGRPQGEPNKTTKASREAFQMLVDRNFDKLESWINNVAADDPHKAFGMVMDLASFCVPKLKAIELSTAKDAQLVVQINRPSDAGNADQAAG